VVNLEGAAAALAIAPIAFVASLIQGVTAFGSALVTIPLATYFVPLPFALAVFAIVDFANALRLGLENPRNAVRGRVDAHDRFDDLRERRGHGAAREAAARRVAPGARPRLSGQARMSGSSCRSIQAI